MRRTRRIVVCVVTALAAALPGLARGKLYRVGPTLPTGTGLAKPCAFEDPDCVFVNWSLPAPITARIPVGGTIRLWRAEALQGAARLLVFQKTPDGVYQLVARSQIRSARCVYDSVSGTCGPAFGKLFVFHSQIAVKTGEWIGIELISPPDCVTSPDEDTCAQIGLFDGSDTPLPAAQIDYFDPTPPMWAMTRSNDFNQEGEILVNALLDTTPKHHKHHKHRKHH